MTADNPTLWLQHRIRSLLLCAMLSGVTHAQAPNQAPPGGTPSQPVLPVPSPPSGPIQSYVPGDIKTEDIHTLSNTNISRDLPAIAPAGRHSVGLALEGGGALGLAHIGVLRWMEEHRIPIDRIAGTSMGCLVSAFYATGTSADDLAALTETDVFSNVLTLRSAYAKSSFRRKQDQFAMPQALTVGLKGGVSLRNSLLADASLNSFLLTHLFAYNREGIDFDTLPISLRCVATDLNTAKPVVFEGGPVPVAVRASIAIPGVFAPVLYQGHYLVDGAIMDNLPTDIVKHDLRSDVVIAVHLIGPDLASTDVRSLVGIFAKAYSAGTALNERRGEALADELITVDTSHFSPSDYGKAHDLIAAGYAATEAGGAKLLPYALSPAAWSQYLQSRQHRQRPAPGTLLSLQVQGESPSVQAIVEHDLKPLKDKPMDAEEIAKKVTQVQADGSLQTKFETFSPDDPQNVRRPVPMTPDAGLLVQFRPVPSGPPFLLVGPEIAAQTSNVTRAIPAFRLIDQNFGGYGSELRTDVRLGYLTTLSTEYYRRLSPRNFYLQPSLSLDRRPIYIWSNQHRIAEQFQQFSGGGLDFGRTFSNQLQVYAAWDAQVVRWHLVNGTSIGHAVSGTSQVGLVHVAYDGAGSSTISAQGLRFDASAGTLYRGPVGEQAPLFKIYANKSMGLGDHGILLLSGEANSYFRHNVSQPMRFTLGGPFRLGASSLDEYRGTDAVLLRTGYLRQIASLPTGLGQGVYLTFAYEGGEIWSPESRSVLRQDGVAGLVAATPVGAITFGTAIGDAGRRKVVFTFGRIF